MTRRFNENNIVDYLHNFDKNYIRPSKHSIFRHKERKLLLKDTNNILTEKNPKLLNNIDQRSLH